MSKPVLILGALLLASIIVPVVAYNNVVSPGADYMASYLDLAYRNRFSYSTTHEPMNTMMGNYLGKMSVLHDSMVKGAEITNLTGRLVYYGMPHMAILETSDEVYVLMLPHKWLVEINGSEKVMEGWELLSLLNNKYVKIKAVCMHEAMEWFMEEIHGMRCGYGPMHEQGQVGEHGMQYTNGMNYMGHGIRGHHGYMGEEAGAGSCLAFF